MQEPIANLQIRPVNAPSFDGLFYPLSPCTRVWIVLFRGLQLAVTCAVCLATSAFFLADSPFAATAEKPIATPMLASRNVVAVVPRHWPPQYSVDEGGNPTGFAVDTMEAIAARAGLTVTYKVVESFPEAAATLRQGDADLIPNSGIVAARMNHSSYTAPLETFLVSIFVRDDTQDLSGETDLAGRKLAVVENNIGLFLFTERKDISLKVFPDVRSALFELLAGHVDALVYPKSVLLGLAREIGIEDRIKTVGQPLREIKRGIQVRKENVALLAVLDAAVNEFIRTPDYQQIYAKWYGKAVPFWTTPLVIAVAAAVILITVLVASAWHYRSVIRLNRALRISEERTRTSMEEAEVANYTKTQFLANMSHELRTPLNSIIGFSQVLMGLGMAKLTPSKYREYALNINVSGNHLLALLQDILDVSKIEAQELTLEPEFVDCKKLIEGCYLMMQERADKGGVKLTHTISAVPTIYADELRLKQILLNLLSNAIKFTPANGEVSVRVESNQEGGVILQVSDTGIGIAENDIPNILKPFGQAKNIFSRDHEGTGLGLTLAKALVELHNGNLEIISQTGKGTTVSVEFPGHRA